MHGLLSYFGEASQPCGNCDNCLNPPAVWDGTDAARKLLCTIYRIQQMSGVSFGAGHLMDIVRGKTTEKGEPVWPRQPQYLWLGHRIFLSCSCVACCAS